MSEPTTLQLVAKCRHRGGVLPVSQQRPGCRRGELSACALGYGDATPGAVTLSECMACVDRHRARPGAEPPGPAEVAALAGAGRDRWIAPLRDASGKALPPETEPWRGASPLHPSEYPVTACIVHLDTPRLLRAVVATLRAQTVNPYILVVDAGSLTRHRAEVEAMQAPDLELAQLNPRGFTATSQPVAEAMDVAFSLVKTRYAYTTHTDVFLRRPDYLEWLLGLIRRPGTPAVGYQMSERKDSGNDWWTKTLSHTANLFDLKAWRQLGLSWSMLGAFERAGMEPRQPHGTGWPDTETHMGMVYHERGVGVRWLGDPDPREGDPWSVLMIGKEPNIPYEDANLRHERSYASHLLYNAPHAATRAEALERSASEAEDRAKSWLAARESA